jgi:hypothetical protein
MATAAAWWLVRQDRGVGVTLSPDGCLVLAGESSFNGNYDTPGAPADAGADGAVDLTSGVAAAVTRPAS